MLNWADMISNLLETIDLNSLNIILGTIAAALAIVAAVFAACRWVAYIIRLQQPVDRLYKALIEHSVASKSEVIYQVKSYTPPRLVQRTGRIDAADKNAKKAKPRRKTIRQLLRQIKAASGEKQSASVLFSIVGKPACGKTTTMRYLYCKLSKSRQCVYFQMQGITDMEALSTYLETQKADNDFIDQTCVVAFFDGLDEAHTFFQQENPHSMEDAFRSIFFPGKGYKIEEIFKKNKLKLDCVVVSLRPEFLERSVQGLSDLQCKNVYSRVYQIEAMTARNALKIFRSLWVLKILERWKDEPKLRHQDRCPPWHEMPHYTWLLRRILKENPNCLFHYPMYIRYAYIFMKQYEEKKGEAAESQQAFSSNIAVAFETLLNAIIKWEFHVFYEDESASGNEKWVQFQEKMKHCAQDIIRRMMNQHKVFLSRDEFQEIVQRFFLDELGRQAMAHCFMTADDRGERYIFCHTTFYEYFLAKYLFKKGNYDLRKKYLTGNVNADYLRAMYYSMICDATLNEKISASTSFISSGLMTLGSYLALEQQKQMDIKAEPSLSLVEILEYLPCIASFQYREREYKQDVLEALMKTGALDVSETRWDRLGYAKGIIPPERVITLNISGLPLKDARTLKEYGNLNHLKMEWEQEDDPVVKRILDQLDHFSLAQIDIKDSQGELCRQIYIRVRAGRFFAQRVSVRTPDYSAAHLKMYQLNRELTALNHASRFYPSVRSDLEKAKEIFHSKNSEKDLEMLTAVFELEADADGMLGLGSLDAGATYWNGLSLAAYYKYKDSIDEDGQATQICRRLEPYIAKDDSEFSAEFGFLYGQLLLFKHDYAPAKIWFTNTYEHDINCSYEKRITECGVRLYKARIRSREKDLDAFARSLEKRIKELSDYQNNWIYTFFLKYDCARKMELWKREAPEPEELRAHLTHYRESAAARYKNGASSFNCFHSLYFEMVYLNRSEHLEEGRALLEQLAQAQKTFEEESDTDPRDIQAVWIEYHEQKLYHALLTDNRGIVLATVEKLLNYPHRRGAISRKKCENIQQAYQETEHSDIDKHQFWGNLWY